MSFPEISFIELLRFLRRWFRHTRGRDINMKFQVCTHLNSNQIKTECFWNDYVLKNLNQVKNTKRLNKFTKS